jgi:ankyrin repeat protein
MKRVYSIGLLSLNFLISIQSVDSQKILHRNTHRDICFAKIAETESQREFKLLCEASKRCLADIVDILIRDGVTINAPVNTTKNTPLSCASTYGHISIVRKLIDAHADVNYVLYDTIPHKTSFNLALQKGYTDIAEILAESGANVDTPGLFGETALHKACRDGHTDIVKLLITLHADVNKKSEPTMPLYGHGARPIHYVSTTNNVTIARMLIQAGAHINKKNLMTGDTALHYASQTGCYDMAHMLIDSGAKLDAQNKNGQSPLHYAVEHDHSLIAEMLIKAGAHINIQDENGETPLHYAFLKGYPHIACMLLSYGAQTDIQRKVGQYYESPFLASRWSCRNTHETITCAIVQSGKILSFDMDHQLSGHIRIINLTNIINAYQKPLNMCHKDSDTQLSYAQLSNNLNSSQQDMYMCRLCVHGKYKAMIQLMKEKHYADPCPNQNMFDYILRTLQSSLTHKQVHGVMKELHKMISTYSSCEKQHKRELHQSLMNNLHTITDDYMIMSCIRICGINVNTLCDNHDMSLLEKAIYLDREDLVRMMVKSEHTNTDDIHAFYTTCRKKKYSCDDLHTQHNHPATKKYAQLIARQRHKNRALMTSGIPREIARKINSFIPY